MFDVGDEIVCVTDEDLTYRLNGEVKACDNPLRKGERFTVLAVYPEGTSVDAGDGWFIVMDMEHIGIGRAHPATPVAHDSWPAHYFRKVERRSIEEGLAALKGLFVPGSKTPELV